MKVSKIIVIAFVFLLFATFILSTIAFAFDNIKPDNVCGYWRECNHYYICVNGDTYLVIQYCRPCWDEIGRLTWEMREVRMLYERGICSYSVPVLSY
ncbi:hypothetical protein M2349_002440 [Caldanaerobacter subterraneus subsp. tengcongensis MB4]|nr:hypothetical protein [Caldanaerobacter subterraneus subsp. tengcongensis MB4]